MRAAHFGFLLLILALVTVTSGGCLWLAVPSLAYEGYKATEGKKTDTRSAQKSHKVQMKSVRSRDHIPDSEME